MQTARPPIDDRRHRLAVALPEASVRLEGDPNRHIVKPVDPEAPEEILAGLGPVPDATGPAA